SIYLTSHDADWHAEIGRFNAPGAQAIVRRAIQFVMDPAHNHFVKAGINKFLLYQTDRATMIHIEDYNGINGFVKSGFIEGKDFDAYDRQTLAQGLNQLGTQYAAIVIGSYAWIQQKPDFDALNTHSAEII